MEGRFRAGLRSRKARPTGLHIAASRGTVTSFPGRRCGGAILPQQEASALTGYGDVFVATGMVAVFACLGNRACDFIRIDAPVRRGLGKIPRLAIGPGGGGAACLALGEALVDAVAVRLVGDDEHAAVGRC